jgi:hypothetical protein
MDALATPLRVGRMWQMRQLRFSSAGWKPVTPGLKENE